MVFNFINDTTGLTYMDIAVTGFNLALCYFYFEICKWLLSEFRVLRTLLKKIGGNRK